ncbi:three component ABC system middle component [Methanoculleus chikugoensis]|uniref:three component ABC system middle component n=1 Tax=Methanoculleus chikugoensis TaxID=118126 RepID=UPI000B0DC9B9|nr:three component ABC system middle component [Methanoculleus chikugoensis]
MNNEDLLNIFYPPQWVSRILHLCISGAKSYNNLGLKYELIYCVLPILAEDELRKNLKQANRNSSFFTVFEQKMTDKQEYLINFAERVDSFSKITRDGLIYLGTVERVDIDSYISTMKPLKYKKSSNLSDSDFQKASYYLGILLAKEDYKTIFLKLGVVP